MLTNLFLDLLRHAGSDFPGNLAVNLDHNMLGVSVHDKRSTLLVVKNLFPGRLGLLHALGKIIRHGEHGGRRRLATVPCSSPHLRMPFQGRP